MIRELLALTGVGYVIAGALDALEPIIVFIVLRFGAIVDVFVTPSVPIYVPT